MKYRTVSIVAAALLLGQAAAYADTFTNANGEQMECHKVRVVHHKQWGTGGTAGTLIGGALGGLAGNQFGKGSGKSAMTAAGAVGGAVVGHEVGKKSDTYVTYQDRCTRVN
jgi:uncharacterized protein YcfJ